MRSTITNIQHLCAKLCSQTHYPPTISTSSRIAGVAREQYRDYSATRGGHMLSTHGSHIRLFGLAFVWLTWVGGCDKPVLDIPTEKGTAGDFCITDADCDDQLACLAEYCCHNKNCTNDCKSLLEKHIHLSPQARSIHPSVTRELQRNCQKMCCEGKTAKEIELEIRQQSMQIPGHNAL